MEKVPSIHQVAERASSRNPLFRGIHNDAVRAQAAAVVGEEHLRCVPPRGAPLDVDEVVACSRRV